jgi:hypothetical protein
LITSRLGERPLPNKRPEIVTRGTESGEKRSGESSGARALQNPGGQIMDWRLVATTAVAGGLGAVAGTLAVPYVGGMTIERPLDTKTIEMAVGILREPVRVDEDPMRSWAIKVVEKKSGIAFSDAQRTTLLKRASAGR